VVDVLSADIAVPADVERLLASIAARGLPLRGVFHAAGVLDDAVLEQQSRERFARVFAPKLAGAWNLHYATHGAPLDHFVLFSSASALLGNVGQANYAAANAFLDALAHYRRAQGLPAISINWGAWAEVGMAAALASGQHEHMAGRGVELIAPAQGVLALERALIHGDTQTAVLPLRWSALFAQFDEGTVPPLFAEMAHLAPAPPTKAASGDDSAHFRQRLASATASERQGLLVERISLHVARVMGLDPHATDPQRSLSELGIDSLMAVELKNRIDGDLRSSVPVTSLLAGPTIVALAADLATQLDAHVAAPVPASHANGHEASPEQLLANLDQLSDDDVDAMLEDLLNN
jgi:acyl carrier protein